MKRTKDDSLNEIRKLNRTTNEYYFLSFNTHFILS